MFFAWARRHDKSEETNYTSPSVDEMQTKIDRAMRGTSGLLDTRPDRVVPLFGLSLIFSVDNGRLEFELSSPRVGRFSH